MIAIITIQSFAEFSQFVEQTKVSVFTELIGLTFLQKLPGLIPLLMLIMISQQAVIRQTFVIESHLLQNALHLLLLVHHSLVLLDVCSLMTFDFSQPLLLDDRGFQELLVVVFEIYLFLFEGGFEQIVIDKFGALTEDLGYDLIDVEFVFLLVITFQYLDLLLFWRHFKDVFNLLVCPFPVLDVVLLLDNLQILLHLHLHLNLKLFTYDQTFEHSYLSFGSDKTIILIDHKLSHIELFYFALYVSESLLFLVELKGEVIKLCLNVLR